MNVTTERNQIIDRFMALNVGDLPELETMPLRHLESMTENLEAAQANDFLNLETENGIRLLKQIVDYWTEQAGHHWILRRNGEELSRHETEEAAIYSLIRIFPGTIDHAYKYGGYEIVREKLE